MFSTGSYVMFILMLLLMAAVILLYMKEESETFGFLVCCVLAITESIPSVGIWFWPSQEIFELTFPILVANVISLTFLLAASFKKKSSVIVKAMVAVLLVSALFCGYTQSAIFLF